MDHVQFLYSELSTFYKYHLIFPYHFASEFFRHLCTFQSVLTFLLLLRLKSSLTFLVILANSNMVLFNVYFYILKNVANTLNIWKCFLHDWKLYQQSFMVMMCLTKARNSEINSERNPPIQKVRKLSSTLSSAHNIFTSLLSNKLYCIYKFLL